MSKRILTFEQAEIIRKWRLQDKKKYSVKVLMKMFSLSKSTVKEIISGRRYKEAKQKGNHKMNDYTRKSLAYFINRTPKFSRARGKIVRQLSIVHNLSPTILRKIARDQIQKEDTSTSWLRL